MGSSARVPGVRLETLFVKSLFGAQALGLRVEDLGFGLQSPIWGFPKLRVSSECAVCPVPAGKALNPKP